MADFTVELANGVVTSYSGAEARHDLNARSGVLVVFDGKGKRLKYSPSGWLCVVDEVTGGPPRAPELGAGEVAVCMTVACVGLGDQHQFSARAGQC